MRRAAQRLALGAVAVGKISEISTQMTVPCPIACAAMNAKMQAGTMS